MQENNERGQGQDRKVAGEMDFTWVGSVDSHTGGKKHGAGSGRAW